MFEFFVGVLKKLLLHQNNIVDTGHHYSGTQNRAEAPFVPCGMPCYYIAGFIFMASIGQSREGIVYLQKGTL